MMTLSYTIVALNKVQALEINNIHKNPLLSTTVFQDKNPFPKWKISAIL